MDYSVTVCLDQLVIVYGFQHVASGKLQSALWWTHNINPWQG